MAGLGRKEWSPGDTLTAADVNGYLMDQSVMVFAGTAARSSAIPTPSTGMVAYSTATGLQLYNGTSWVGVSRMKNVATFTASGSWTVPTGVTYAIAYIRAGGGGVGTASAGAGGTSSVAFAGGTISALGGVAVNHGVNVGVVTSAGQANSGNGALFINDISGATPKTAIAGGVTNGALITAGGSVTPGASITITVGAGGVAGTGGSAGGTGYIYIEFEV
jgi:hypothetical protein